jgi:hypothetical protein
LANSFFRLSLRSDRRSPPFGGRHFVFNLPDRDPHDMDGFADHVGGAALAFGASGHHFTRLSWS